MPKETTASWIPICALNDLSSERPIVKRVGDHTVALFLDGEAVRAVDNRCPHMGFPLSKGTVNNGMITCYWHHARFDGESGCAFDLFADDVPAFDTKIECDQVFVFSDPRQKKDAAFYRRRLRHGLEQNIEIVIAKSLIGLVRLDESLQDILGLLADFGSRNHEQWSQGMTGIAMVPHLWPSLQPTTRIHLLITVAKWLAMDCRNRPSRRERGPLAESRATPGRLREWFRQWARVRHRDGMERTALTIAAQYPVLELADMLYDVTQDRVFAAEGHMLDFINKLLELNEYMGGEAADSLLPLLMPSAAQSVGAEDRSNWRSPVDLIGLINDAEGRLREKDFLNKIGEEEPASELLEVWLGEDPGRIVATLIRTLESGVSPQRLARSLAHAASLRLAKFPKSNDISDWFNPVHTFHFANAVECGLARSSRTSFGTLRGLFHVAMAVYLDRFLNIPEARIPGERPGELDALPSTSEAILDGFLEQLDSVSDSMQSPIWVVRYLRLGFPEPLLIDRLVYAALREDLDFHKLQTIEAAVRQASNWPEGAVEREHLYVGAARHLAAHCPTRRSGSKMTHIALRLERGEALHEESKHA